MKYHTLMAFVLVAFVDLVNSGLLWTVGVLLLTIPVLIVTLAQFNLDFLNGLVNRKTDEQKAAKWIQAARHTTKPLKNPRIRQLRGLDLGDTFVPKRAGKGLILTVPERLQDTVHPHQRYTYFFYNKRWTPLGLECLSSDDEVKFTYSHIWGSVPGRISFSSYLRFRLTRSLGQPVPEEISFLLDGGCLKSFQDIRDYTETKFAINAAKALQSGLTAYDFHNLCSHPENFSAETRNPDLKDIPVAFVKAMYGLDR